MIVLARDRTLDAIEVEVRPVPEREAATGSEDGADVGRGSGEQIRGEPFEEELRIDAGDVQSLVCGCRAALRRRENGKEKVGFLDGLVRLRGERAVDGLPQVVAESIRRQRPVELARDRNSEALSQARAAIARILRTRLQQPEEEIEIFVLRSAERERGEKMPNAGRRPIFEVRGGVGPE